MPGNVATFLLGPFAAGAAASIVAVNTPAGAGNLVVIGGTFVMDSPRRVAVTLGATEAANRQILIKGTNVFGQPISENFFAVLNAVTVTKQDFATVTSVAVFAAFTTTMSVGTMPAAGAIGSPVASTPWFEVDINRNPANVNVGVTRLDSSAALANGFIIEATFDDPNAGYANPGVLQIASSNNPSSNVPPIVYGDGAIVGNYTAAAAKKTANLSGLVSAPYFALRAALYDTTPAQVTAQFIQSGINGA